MATKCPPWRKDVFDKQVQERIVMGALDPNDSLDEIKSGHSDLLGRFSDDQVMRNVRRVAKQLSKKGLLSNVSSPVATGGTTLDSDDDSVGVASMSTPNKKSRPDLEDNNVDNNQINSMNISLPTLASRCKDPDTEEKKCSAVVVLPGGTVDVEVKLNENINSTNEVIVSVTLGEAFSNPINYLQKCFPDISPLHPLVSSLKDSLRDMRQTIDDTPTFHSTIILPTQVQTSNFTRETQIASVRAGDRKHMQTIVLIFTEVPDGCTKKTEKTRYTF